MPDNVSVEFVSTSILRIHEFSWVFLIDWIMIVLLAIFSIFYFNQLLGFVVTHTVGWYVWHRYDIYFKVEAIQISLLAGRIMFSNVVYIGTSEAARIVHGSIGWRYWIRNRRRSAFVGGAAKGDCALELKANGVEWFVYNREYAYEVLGKSEPASAELAREFEEWQQSLSTVERKFSELLPMHIAARNLAIVIGNDETECLAVVSAPSADGVLDMDMASNESDRYSLRLGMQIDMPEAELRKNPDHQLSSIEPKTSVYRNKRTPKTSRMPRFLEKLKRNRNTGPQEPWMGLRRYMEESNNDMPQPPYESEATKSFGFKTPQTSPTSPSSQESPTKHSTYSRKDRSRNSFHSANSAQTRVSTNEEDDHDDSGASKDRNYSAPGPLNPAEIRSRLAALPTEYAKVSQILACDRLDLYVLFDVVGTVTGDESKHDDEPLHSISIRMHESKMNFGPWAERQRQQFWSLFFPRQCVDSQVPEERKPGELRLQKRSMVAVELLGESVCLVPVREMSKDEQFAASFARNYGAFGDDIQRNYGWVELRVLEGSSLSAVIPFVPDHSGFVSECSIDLQKPEVRSSVTHDTMFYAASHHLEIKQHVPLVWNALQYWTVENVSTDMDFFVLREHITLLADMINDFSQGPATPYALFIPMRYKVTWNLINFTLFLNVNKNNIINKPTSRSENTFIMLRTPLLDINWDLPNEEITAPTSASKCVIKAEKLDLELSAPNWHTLQSFLDSPRMARVDDFEVQWSLFTSTLPPEHRYSDTEQDVNLSRFVDTQIIDIKGTKLAMSAYGFLIDYVMRIRENYFGHAYHFQTTEEFLQRHQSNEQPNFEFSRADLDVDAHLHVQVDQGVFLFPQKLYSARDSVALHFAHLAMDCRFTNYYMDLQAEFEPVVGRHLRGLNCDNLLEVALEADSDSILSISQVEIRAHRMFGLPPSEPTYVVKWDFDIGDISVNADTTFLDTKDEVARSFAHGFSDDENKPLSAVEELNDVTFLSANISSVVVTLRPADANEDVCIELDVGPIKVRHNDLANTRYSGRATLEIPFLQLKCYINGIVALEASTAIYVTNFMKKHHADEFRAKQQRHIALHDALFHRAPFLLEPQIKNSEPFSRKRQHDDIKPCIPLLPFAPPLTRETIDMLSPAGAEYDATRASGGSEGASDASFMGGGDGTDSGASTPGTSLYGSYRSSDTLGTTRHYGSQSNLRSTTPEVYPFASSEATNERQKLRRKRTNFHLRSTTWRANAPTLPDDDDDYEHMSVIIQFTAVTVEVTPAIATLVAALDVEPKVSFEAELDNLQHSIVKALVKSEAAPEHVRVHYVVPIISLHLSEQLRSVHGLLCEMKHIDIMWSSTGKQRGIHAELNSFSIALRNAGGNLVDLARINAASMVLSKVVFWWSETGNRKGTGALDFAGLDLGVATDQVDWIVSYATDLAVAIASSSKTKKSPAQRPKTMSAMFYALTMAGEQMGVEQDSYVLSRPSGAVQSRSHVRSQISWRIVMRLRYLLQRIPPEQLDKMQRDVARGRFQLPSDARQRMLAVYRRWRSWEQSDNLEDSEIFKQVLQDQSFQEYVLSMSTRFALSIESMVVRLVYPGMREHYLGLDLLVAHLDSTRMSETQNLSITLRCSKLRAFGSIELVLVAVAIMVAVADAADRYNDRMASFGSDEVQISRTETEDEYGIKSPLDYVEPELPQPTTKIGMALQASISMFLLDLVLEFDLEMVKIETQNHQVQFTASVELMQTSAIESLFHTGVLATSNGAFRIFRPASNQEIFDSLITGIHVGYASRGPSHRSNTWATVNAESLSLAVHPTTPELARLFLEFVETELPVLCRVGEKLKEANSRHNDPADSIEDPKVRSASITSLYSQSNDVGAGQFVNLSLESMKLRVALVDDLRLVLQGRKMDMKLRHTDALVGSLDLERGTLGIHYGENLASVAKIQIETAKAVLRLDQQNMAIALISDIGALRMETMSLVWLLEYLGHRKLDTQIEQIVDDITRAIELLQDATSKDDNDSSSIMIESRQMSEHDNNSSEEGEQTSPKFKLRLLNRIREITVVLPLDTSQFKLTLAEIKAKVENFKQVEDLNQQRSIPQTVGIEVSDLALMLSLPHKLSREMLRLQFSVNLKQEDEQDTFNVHSEYVRFAIDPEAVGALFVALDKVNQHTRALFKNSQFQSAAVQSPTPDTGTFLKPLITSEPVNEPPKKRFRLADLERLRINLLLKSLTVSWFTDSTSQDGIVLGYERLQVRVAKLFARLELIGTYITPVTAPKRDEQPISERSNTAYLPLVDARLYVIEKQGGDPCIHVSMMGKSVTLLISSSVAPWVLKLLTSWKQARDTVNYLAAHRPRSRSSTNESVAPSSPSTSSRNPCFRVPFELRTEMHFESGVLRIFEENFQGGEPALQLFSPAVDITAHYLKNQLFLRVDVSPTSNKLYPKAVSEIKAIWSQLSMSVEKHQTESLAPRRSPSPPPLTNIANPPQSVVMEDLQLDIRVQLGSQELYLSCLPFGKVGVLLSTEQVDVLVATPRSHKRDDPYLVAQMFARDARVSLQHIYSREISAMAEFSQLSVVGLYRPEEPLKLAVSLRDPQLMLKLAKLHDMRTFFEIWKFYENPDNIGTPTPEPEPTPTTLRRKYSTSSRSTTSRNVFNADGSSEKHEPRNHGEEKSRLIDRYKSAVTSVAIPWTVNISITNLGAVVGMGPSIGDVKFSVDRIWAALLKSSTAEQALHGGIDCITAQLDGRFGGTLRMDSLMAKAAVHWGEDRDYPLLHAKLRMGKLGFYFSLDFHPFIAGEVVALAVAMTTQDCAIVNEERIYMVASCESVSLVFTALVVSHAYDVISLFKRLQSQISNAPIFMAPESTSTEDSTRHTGKHSKHEKRAKGHGSRNLGIRTIFDIKLGNLLVHIFPTEFTDTVALKVFANRVSVQFDRKEQEYDHVTSVDFALNECLVGLANIRGGYPKTMMDLNYEEFLMFVRRSASGGTIVNTPEISMLMDTVEPKGKNEVHYTFSNHLLGSIEVGWNLGSVNFIKEMLETHKQAWATRPSVNTFMRYDEDNDSQFGDSRSLRRENTVRRTASLSTTTTYATSAESDMSDISINEEDSIHEASDHGLHEQLEEAQDGFVVFGGIRYIATSPPVILIPQLRDLGDATPPIEWLGVNRERLPLFLHHFITRKLEFGADELEEVYQEVMGKLD